MNYQSANGMTISNDEVFINGQKVEIPDKLKKQLQSGRTAMTCINDKKYLNGYEYLGDGEWKQTLTALWYKYF